jgi:hypothetical protein
MYWSQVGQTEKNTEIREKTRRGTERFLFLFFLPYLRAYSVFSVFLIRDQYSIYQLRVIFHIGVAGGGGI